MNAPQLEIGIISLGNHARKNMAPAIVAAPEFKLGACTTRNEAVADAFAKEFGVAVYNSLVSFLTEEDGDAVYISSPTGVHFEQVMACLEMGRHCLVEKSAFVSQSETERACALAEERDLVLMEGFMFKYHHQFRALLELAACANPHDFKSIECRFGFPHLDRENIRYDRKLGGGALNDVGAYALCSARGLLGESSELLWSRISTGDGFDVDTAGQAILANEHSQTAHCSWSFGASYVNRIEIWCADRIIDVDRAFSKPPNLPTSIVSRNNGEVVERIEIAPENHFVAMLSVFADAIRTGTGAGLRKELLAQARMLESVRKMGQERINHGEGKRL